MDSPVEIGSFQESDFDEGGGHYRVVVDADPADYDMQKIVPMLRQPGFRGHGLDGRPALSNLSVSLSLSARARGRRHGARLLAPPSMSAPAGWPRIREALADLTAHEFFHLWNVKRIRPQSLEPVDYTKENYTAPCGSVRASTTTAGNIILLRAGLLDEATIFQGRWLARLANWSGVRLISPSRWKSPAWTRGWKNTITIACPRAAFPTTTRDNLLGVLLDLQVREASHGSASMRDVFHWMNEHYARKGEFFP